VLMARVSQDDNRRVEALREYLAVTQVADLNAADTLAMMVPPLMPALYRRWAGMFAERLFETARQDQLAVLCDGSEENGGALALAFVMFLESERMERQTAEDLRAFGGGGKDDPRADQLADLAASYLRARVANLAQKQAGKQAEKDAASSSEKQGN